MAEGRMLRRNSYYRRNRYENSKGSYIKRTILKQTAVCVAVIAAVVLTKDTFLPEDSFGRKATSYILNENTDFKAGWEELKAFFKEQVRVTGLLNGALELDPVRNMMPPAVGEVYQGFGLVKDEKSGSEEFCYGVKLKLTDGAKISCASNGSIAEVGTSDDYGKYILVKHSEQIYSYYAGLAEILPETGEEVKAGQVIATVGVNEKEKVPMLYFELRDGESMLDPEVFIDFTGGGKKS